MSTLPEFGSGQVRLLWKTGSHDGMASAVAFIDERIGPVYLDAFEHGFECLTAPWRELESLMEKLIDDDDFENIWDRLERKYKSQMMETRDRAFNIHVLPSDEFDSLLEDHRAWQLHAGLGSDYWYGDDGKPKLCDPAYWTVPRAYLHEHYYKHVDWFARQARLTAFPKVGTISRTNLYAASELRVPKLEDPRSEELRIYQVTWREGDLVRTEW